MNQNKNDAFGLMANIYGKPDSRHYAHRVGYNRQCVLIMLEDLNSDIRHAVASLLCINVN